MILDKKILEKILVLPGHISDNDLAAALKESEKSGNSIEQILVKRGFIKDQQLGKLIAESAGHAFIELRNEKIDLKTMNMIPELVARSKQLIVFRIKDDIVMVGMRDPGDMEVRRMIEKKFLRKIKAFYITEDDFNEAFFKYKINLKEEYQELIDKLSASSHDEASDKDLIRLVDIIIEYGHFNRASDIHIEPQRNRFLVRYRVDGMLHEAFVSPKPLLEKVLARIKILAKMRIDEHRASQDGRIHYEVEGSFFDIRVSIIPVISGENIVLRLLSAEARSLTLEDLGLSGNDLTKVKKAIRKKHGMILVSGPTGSGKTTTVYEILKKLNSKEVNIATIEDPVEYDIEGISQIQASQSANLTFAKGLKAIVRQDPDIIMIGEIRDEETAKIAVNAAMTGHLVISTLHANDAATVLPRLIEMNVEPFLIASTVNISIAQRLVRKICERCRATVQPTKSEIEFIENEPAIKSAFISRGRGDISNITFFKGNGCHVCGHTGYKDRVGVFEVFELSEGIKKLIIDKASSGEIAKMAVAEGMVTILENGVEKVLSGETSLSELFRVLNE